MLEVSNNKVCLTLKIRSPIVSGVTAGPADYETRAHTSFFKNGYKSLNSSKTRFPPYVFYIKNRYTYFLLPCSIRLSLIHI